MQSEFLWIFFPPGSEIKPQMLLLLDFQSPPEQTSQELLIQRFLYHENREFVLPEYPVTAVGHHQLPPKSRWNSAVVLLATALVLPVATITQDHTVPGVLRVTSIPARAALHLKVFLGTKWQCHGICLLEVHLEKSMHIQVKYWCTVAHLCFMHQTGHWGLQTPLFSAVQRQRQFKFRVQL